ncbi:MAG TPA: lytic transglycosylase domain-containing protein [Spirochaetia bacterium]|nr:lytic transglycosylase domain-containing protein [Spirochaetia bacterium]
MPIRFRILPTLFLSFLLTVAGSCVLPQTAVTQTGSDALLVLYREDHLKSLVVDYYAHLTGNRPVTMAILEACDELDISPSLGFALAWNESRFDPRAVRYNETTMDRGLFQLNSRTFARLDRKTLFDPRANALHGLTYYKKALDRLGTEEKALGYYNAGIGLLSDRALPRSTQAYVKKILADRDRMDKDAIAWIYFSHDTRLALK